MKKENPEDVKWHMASCKKFVLIMYEIYDWNKASFDIHENDYGGQLIIPENGLL